MAVKISKRLNGLGLRRLEGDEAGRPPVEPGASLPRRHAEPPRNRFVYPPPGVDDARAVRVLDLVRPVVVRRAYES